MVALMQKQKVEYSSAADLMKNNASDGSWQGQFLDLHKERGEQIDAIQAGLNEEAALGNINRAQAATATQYVINPITGEVLETDGASEGDLSVAGVISLIEMGASDTEIAAALDDALASVAGMMAKDKKNGKKHLAQLMELMHVLEVSLKQAGKNVDLQNTLKQMQQKLSKLLQNGSVKEIQEFLRSSQLREVLTKSVQQSRQNIDALRTVHELVRNLAKQAKDANIPRDVALQNLQQSSRDILQNLIRKSVSDLRASYSDFKAEFKQETNPATRETLKNAIKEVARQAELVQRLSKESQNTNIATTQLQQTLAAVQLLQGQTAELANNAQLGQVGQQIAERLAANQQADIQALNARTAAQRVAEGNLNVAQQAGRQDALANLRGLEKAIEKTNPNLEAVKPNDVNQLQNSLERGVEQAAKDASQKEPTKLEALQQKLQAANDKAAAKAAAKEAEAALKAKKLETQRVNQDDSRVAEKEAGDPCKGCGGGKGCCSSEGTAEKAAVESIDRDEIDKVAQNHSDFRAVVESQEKTSEAIQVEQGFGAPPPAPVVAEINAPPPPSPEIG